MVELAASSLKEFGKPLSLAEAGLPLNLRFRLLLVYTEEEGMKTGFYLNSDSWAEHEVYYGGMCILVLIVSKKSQQDLP